ncbi:unnamed protein product [Calicophoron daubneyi]|uniref:Uncharacterized protein n=1 Tax=Calicophoron daubneyi TaxID=300641 RepID=A0AAV2TCF4_CALDB
MRDSAEMDNAVGRSRLSLKEQTPFVSVVVPPELVPPGITVLTSPVGFQAIIELYIWAFPSPLPENSMVEGYSTPSGLSSCLRARSMAAVKLLAKNSEHTYSWYKVKTAGKPPNVKVHSRQRVSGISGGEIFQNYNNDPTSGGPRTNKQSGAPHVWSDVILINLASVYSRQLYRQALQGNKSAQINRDRIPTIVYRLFFDVVQEKDYGEYMCEIDHISGRKNFLVRLQPPVVAGESNRPVQFSRQGSTVHLYFDPSIMKSPQDSRDLETTGTVFSLTGNIASKTSPGEQATRTPRKRGNFTWLLLRVCALSEKSNRNDTNGEEIFSCDENKGGPGSFNTESVFFGLRALPETIYGRAIRQDSCIDRVIENPEKGSAVIKLDDYADSWFVHSSRPRSLPSLTARSQPEGIGNDEASLKRETDRFWSTRSINDPEESSSSALVQSSSLSWRQVEKVVYQLRFYDSHGSLDHTTDWFIENDEIPVIVDQGCLSLKNPLGGAKDDFFQASCPKQESYYIGNASVIDSPCPVSGARGFTGKHLLLKPLSHPIDSPTDGFGLPVDAIQLLPSNMCKSIPVCMNEGKANSPNDDYQSHLWRIYRQNAKQSSGDESDSLILSRELVQLYENKNSSALKLIPDEQRNENRSNSSAAYSSSTLSQLSPWSQMRSNDGNIQSSGPLQIYNKCYNPHEDSPLDNGPQPLCGTPSMPAVCKGFTRPSKLFQNIEAGLFSEGYNPTAIPPQAPLYRPHIHRSPKSTRGQQNGGEFSNWPTYLVGTSPFPSISTSRPTCATQVLQRRVTPTGKEFRFAYDTGSLKAPGCTLPNAFSLGSGEKIRTEKPGNSAALSKVDTVPSIITPDVLNAQEICGLETFQRKRQAPDENLSRVHSAGLNENVHVQKTFTVPGPKELGYIIQNTCISEKDHTVPQSSQNCLIAHKETAS